MEMFFHLPMSFQGDCWICMELMDTSLDKFYKIVHEKLNQRIPESFLGKVTMAVSYFIIIAVVNKKILLYML